MRRRLTLGLTLLLALTFMPAAGQRPEPHSWTKGRPEATAQATLSGCEMVVPYADALFTAIDDSGAFLDFFTTPDYEVGDISTDEAEDVITNGKALIAELKQLDAPGPYVGAHRNIIVFFQIQIDTAHFLGIDTSQVPDIAASDAALDAITAGEMALATACPDEVAAIDGYVLIAPSNESTPPVPKHVPEGDLTQDTRAVVWSPSAMEHEINHE